MSALRTWWSGLSGRERRLIQVMLAALAGVVLWLGVWRPVRAGLEDGRARLSAAADLNASVRSRIALLRKLPSGGGVGDAGAIVAQSAADAGLTLDRNAAEGEGRIGITIGSARATALFGWLSQLEARGVWVETLTATPGTTPGTVVVQAVLRGRT